VAVDARDEGRVAAGDRAGGDGERPDLRLQGRDRLCRPGRDDATAGTAAVRDRGRVRDRGEGEVASPSVDARAGPDPRLRLDGVRRSGARERAPEEGADR